MLNLNAKHTTKNSFLLYYVLYLFMFVDARMLELDCSCYELFRENLSVVCVLQPSLWRDWLRAKHNAEQSPLHKPRELLYFCPQNNNKKQETKKFILLSNIYLLAKRIYIWMSKPSISIHISWVVSNRKPKQSKKKLWIELIHTQKKTIIFVRR